ncbi:MAG: GPR endopeptidase [Clostridia bacterium]|nr:GPR endopeptidase [Clostridia bacterium]
MKNLQSIFDKSYEILPDSHTDLACECPPKARNTEGAVFYDFEINGFRAARLEVTNEKGEAATGRPRGTYVTLFCPDMPSPHRLSSDDCATALSSLLSDFIKGAGISINADTKVLIAGLGNRFITCDAVGPLSADKILATAHLNRENPDFARLEVPDVSIIFPGVSSQTGIETADMIRSAADACNADVIIAIDALAARSTERLCSTVQISDSGIHPGAGIGNRREPITEKTMGRKVISIGVPTVISSSTLIYDALETAGIDCSAPKLKKLLCSGKGFFVSHGESDTICQCAAEVIALGIEKTFMKRILK